MNLNFSANMAGFCRDSHIYILVHVYSSKMVFKNTRTASEISCETSEILNSMQISKSVSQILLTMHTTSLVVYALLECVTM